MAQDFSTNIIIGGKINPNLKRVFDTAGQLAQKTSGIIEKTNKKMSLSAKSLSDSLHGVVDASKKLALVGAAAGAAAILGGKALIDQASGMEQYRNTLNVVMKDQKKAAETFQWAVDFANRTPFETDEIIDATVKLQSYGLEAQKIMPFVGDMAASMGKGIDQAVEAIADAQSGELERLKEFGITKAQIVEHANQVLAGVEVVNNKGQITNQKAFNLALLDLMKQRFEGGMETQAKTYKGVMSTITGIWKTGLAEMAGVSPTGKIVEGSFFDVIKTKAEEFGKTLERMQADGTFQKLQTRIADFASIAAQKLEEIIPKIIQFGDYVIKNGPQILSAIKWIGGAFIAWKVISGVNSAVQTMMQLSNALSLVKAKYIPVLAFKAKDRIETLYLQGLYAKDAIVMAAKTVGLWAMTMAQNAWNIATTAGAIAGKAFGAVMAFLTSPIGIVVLAITALIAAVYLLWKNWDTISKALVKVWQNYVVPFFQGISSWFSNIFDGVSETFRGFVNFIIGGLNGLINKVNSIKFKVPDWIPEWLGGGKTLGINIPTIPTFAQGGIATRASIFGEAGPEIAIPLRPKEPRSISLLLKAAKILNVPMLPTFAQGSIATRASIFGEAGPEIAIPLRPKEPRSISLIKQNTKNTGIQPSGTNITIVYSPNITGGNAADIETVLEVDYERFKTYIEQFFHEKGRESFA